MRLASSGVKSSIFGLSCSCSCSCSCGFDMTMDGPSGDGRGCQSRPAASRLAFALAGLAECVLAEAAAHQDGQAFRWRRWRAGLRVSECGERIEIVPPSQYGQDVLYACEDLSATVWKKPAHWQDCR